jgi:general L-amino acid transport system substrate-binding protein
MKKFLVAAIAGLGLAVTATAVSAQAPATLAQVKSRNILNCGSNTGLAGFGVPDAQGNWVGLDVDYCRAVAAAIFNDPAKVKFIPLSAKDRFTALQSGEVDLLVRNSTWTMSRDSALGLLFTGVNYYDGQGFLVRKKLGVTSALQLSGASVCTQQGTTTELNLADFFRANNLKYEVVAFASSDETVKAYDAGRCDAFTTDASGLYAERLKLTAPDDHMVLPEIISKEPLGPSVRNTDAQWFNLVKVGALRHAERRGTRRDQGQCRRDAEVAQSRDQASARCRGQVRRRHRPHRRLGLSHRQAGRQLRRILREERRPGLAAEDCARPERTLDQGRPAIRPAGSLTSNQIRAPTSFGARAAHAHAE